MHSYECDKCRKVFKSARYLNAHDRVCRGVHTLACSTCFKTFASVQSRCNHEKRARCGLSKEPIKENLACAICGKEFTSKAGLRYHQTHVDCRDTRSYTCELCNKTFRSRQALWNHRHRKACAAKPVTERKQPTCDICSKVFASRQSLCNHRKRGCSSTLVTSNEFDKVLDDVVYDDEYVDRMDRIVNTGKYGVVECIERLWFMKGMSIRKRRKNDEFVEIYEAGKWETRVFADVFPNMMKKIERYHDPYFDRIRANWSGLTPRAKQKRLYVLRCYGHAMLWYGWTGQSIEKIGTYLNEPDDEPERKRRVRVMSKLFMEKIYHLSRSMRAL